MSDTRNVMNSEDRVIEIDVIQLFKALWEKAIYLVLITVIVGLLGYVGSTLLITPIYEASGKLIVITRNPDDKVSNDQLNSAKNLVDTYAIIIRDRDVVNQVISELNLPTSYEQLANAISVKAINNTQIMKVAVRHWDRATALAITQKIVEIVPDIIQETVGSGSAHHVGQVYAGTDPVAPNNIKNAILAAAIGLLASSAVVVVLFLLDNTYKSDADVQNDLDVIVLGMIPKLECCETKYGYASKYGYGYGNIKQDKNKEEGAV